ncbi:hypothetical protein CCACVL1_05269, partial [Corchorus capsularis]
VSQLHEIGPVLLGNPDPFYCYAFASRSRL